MLIIDEAIAREREKAKEIRENIIDEKNLEPYESYCIAMAAKRAEEHEQLAELLEELKEYRKHIELTEIPEQYKLGFQDGIVNGFENGYNKAIDDFASELENHSIYADIGKLDEVKMEWVSPVTRIKEVAEQLKAGEAE